MKVVGVQFHFLDDIYHFDPKDFDLAKGELVIAETDQGVEAGRVVFVKDLPDKEIKLPLRPILRRTTTSDLEKIEKYKTKETKALNDCRKLIKKNKLPMKLEGILFAFDGSRITFYFTAEERVDFRSLVKDLTRHFQKSIRLQQIGTRDVASRLGGIGLCGRELCCRKFLKDFSSITTEMARLQQMAQRGSERITGVCGRLMCCLSFEANLYEELSKKIPKIGDRVKTEQGEGEVVGINIIMQKVEVQLDKGNRIVFDAKKVKKIK